MRSAGRRGGHRRGGGAAPPPPLRHGIDTQERGEAAESGAAEAGAALEVAARAGRREVAVLSEQPDGESNIIFVNDGQQSERAEAVGGGDATSVPHRPSSARRGPPTAAERAGYATFKLPSGGAAASSGGGASVGAAGSGGVADGGGGGTKGSRPPRRRRVGAQVAPAFVHLL